MVGPVGAHKSGTQAIPLQSLETRPGWGDLFVERNLAAFEAIHLQCLDHRQFFLTDHQYGWDEASSLPRIHTNTRLHWCTLRKYRKNVLLLVWICFYYNNYHSIMFICFTIFFSRRCVTISLISFLFYFDNMYHLKMFRKFSEAFLLWQRFPWLPGVLACFILLRFWGSFGARSEVGLEPLGALLDLRDPRGARGVLQPFLSGNPRRVAHPLDPGDPNKNGGKTWIPKSTSIF